MFNVSLFIVYSSTRHILLCLEFDVMLASLDLIMQLELNLFTILVAPLNRAIKSAYISSGGQRMAGTGGKKVFVSTFGVKLFNDNQNECMSWCK